MFLFFAHAFASPLELPDSIARSAITETRATATPVFQATTDDFTVGWTGEPLAGVTLTLVPGSLEWVRVAEVMVVPRARIRVSAPPGRTGSLRVEGLVTPLLAGGETEAPVALLSGLPLEIALDSAQATATVTYTGPFRARRDISCSHYRVQLSGGHDGSWAHVGCRRAIVADGQGRTSALALVVTWDHGSPDLPPLQANTWLLQMGPEPGEAVLEEAAGSLSVRYRLPARHHDLAISALIGGSFQPDSGRGTAMLGLVRVFADYGLTDTSGVFVYDYANLHPSFLANDLGGYYRTRISALLDGRVELSTLLGAHLQSFLDSESLHTEIGFPQGFDITVLDLPAPSWRLSMGGFAGPPIKREWYANTYLRVGRGAFLELAFTGWAKEVAPEQLIDQRLVSIGIGGMLLGL